MTPAAPISERLNAALTGRYVVQGEVGEGGMATVFLAQDVRHERRVALKVLRPELAALVGGERFLAEIRTTANLQHPHVLPLFDSGEVDGFLFYVMPFVDGESLRARLERERHLPVAEAVRLAREVADALAYAHASGVVHRDIKPENILLHGGHALVADFGIALAVETAGGTRLTQTGLSLGTPQYMAPEQAMGDGKVDGRADLYALGVVTYEMLAGEPPFTGPSAQAIVARIMTERPRPLGEMRDTVPEAVEDAVHAAMAKLPADRFGTATEFAAALGPGAPVPPLGRRHRAARALTGRRAVYSVVAALALVVATFASGWWVSTARGGPPPAPPPERRAVLPLSAEFDVRGADLVASPDGRMLALTDAGRIVVRHLDRIDLVPVPAPGDAQGLSDARRGVAYPFLSDDRARIGFVLGRDLVVQGLDGSGRITIPDVAIAGGAFLDEDRVAVVDTAGLAIVRLSRAGRERIVSPAPGATFLQPIVLPGGRHVLLSAVRGDLEASRILRVDLQARTADTLPLGPALRPQVAGGWLYFARPSGVLYAVPFDPDAAVVRGEPLATGEQVVVARQGRVTYAAAAGLLAFGFRPQTRLVALSADGRRTVLVEAPGTYHSPRVSPDGRQVVFDRDDGGQNGRDVWILDLATQALSRATAVGDAHDPVWTPDGRRITYLSLSTPGGPIVTVASDGTAGQSVIGASGSYGVNPGAWLPDGSAYIGGVSREATNSDVVAFAPDGGEHEPLVASRFDEHSPAVSPDGRWLAYVSYETGRAQVYVRPLRGEGRTLVSEGAGEEPVWSRDGRELYFVESARDASRVILVRLEGAGPRVVERRVLVEDLRYEPVGNHANWDVMPDGRMVFVEPIRGTQVVLVFDHRPEGRER